MEYTDILYEVKDGVAWLTINRPEKGNLFRPQTIRELTHALQRVRDEADQRVAVLTGAGDRFFCIGGEHDEHDPRLHYGTTMPVMDLYDLLDKHPKPIIAMVNGFAVGGGNVTALMCDFTLPWPASVLCSGRWGRPWGASTPVSAPGTWRRPWAASAPRRSGC